MDYIQVIVLALTQGITEFLPISSSAHLILLPKLSNWVDYGLAFDVMIHLGTLTAVIHYFRAEILSLTCHGLYMVTGKTSELGEFAYVLVVATIPASIIGFVLHDFITNNLRTVEVIAISTIGFALLLGFADYKHKNNSLYSITCWQALFIGCMQALALIPGTSRSGITITAALLIGLNRSAATKFSMLLAIPLILAASLLQSYKLISTEQNIQWSFFLLGFAVSTISAWLCIHFLLKLVERIGMLPFIIYRIILGLLLLFYFA